MTLRNINRRQLPPITLLLILYLACAHALASSSDYQWLDTTISERFKAIETLNFENTDAFQAIANPYFEAQGLTDKKTIDSIIKRDLHHIAHALTLLFDTPVNTLIESQFSDKLSQALVNISSELDHVGREVIGPLPFYLTLLMHQAPVMNIKHMPQTGSGSLTEEGNLIFPSTAVVLEIKKYDPDVSTILIARIYFTDQKTPEAKSLELFQVISVSPKKSLENTETRLATLHANHNENRPSEKLSNTQHLIPIDHIAFSVSDKLSVYAIHQAIADGKLPNAKVYQDNVGLNPADRSVNTKLTTSNLKQPDLFNTIVELVYYQPFNTHPQTL